MIKLIRKLLENSKDEAAGIPITEFIGLRSKMYSYIKNNDQNNKTAKGIIRIVIQKISNMKTTNKLYSIKNKCIMQ